MLHPFSISFHERGQDKSVRERGFTQNNQCRCFNQARWSVSVLNGKMTHTHTPTRQWSLEFHHDHPTFDILIKCAQLFREYLSFPVAMRMGSQGTEYSSIHQHVVVLGFPDVSLRSCDQPHVYVGALQLLFVWILTNGKENVSHMVRDDNRGA